MTQEHMMEQLMAQNKDVAALWESAKSAHKRIDETDEIIKGIHRLAANVETLALEVKLLTQRMDSSIARMERSIKSQGVRIGAVETQTQSAEHSGKSIAVLEGKVQAMEKEPADRWREMVRQVVTIAGAALAGSLLAGVLGVAA